MAILRVYPIYHQNMEMDRAAFGLRFNAEPKRWIRVTPPLFAAVRFVPALSAIRPPIDRITVARTLPIACGLFASSSLNGKGYSTPIDERVCTAVLHQPTALSFPPFALRRNWTWAAPQKPRHLQL